MGFEVLSNKDVLLVFAYSPAGLGHLRVTEALYHGLPKATIPHLLGSNDRSVSYIHRIASINTVFRNAMEWGQKGKQEDFFTHFHRRLLYSGTQSLYQKLITIFEQRIDSPKIVIVIATHFGLAHQLSLIKSRIETEKKIKILLVVQVTDDSPQHIWYVPNADLIVVPSHTTKEELIQYGEQTGLPPVTFAIAPYPVSPLLIRQLSKQKYQQRIDQLKPGSKSAVNIAIPISGAAVGTKYFTKLIDLLYQKSQRFSFKVVSKIARYTRSFISEINTRPYVNLFVSSFDRGTVEKYEQVYTDNVISLEVTKPSEQAFKALINPTSIGGALLLFAKPVGRQEYDNLYFLRRHSLIPEAAEQKYLWDNSQKNTPLKESKKKYLTLCANWRGILLPSSPFDTAQFIIWCLKEGIFSQMLKCKVLPRKNNSHIDELSSNGVQIFWEKVAGVVQEAML